MGTVAAANAVVVASAATTTLTCKARVFASNLVASSGWSKDLFHCSVGWKTQLSILFRLSD